MKGIAMRQSTCNAYETGDMPVMRED